MGFRPWLPATAPPGRRLLGTSRFKPIEFVGRAMRYSSRNGTNVMDLLGGSGSTRIGDVAWQSKANAISMVAAVKPAVKLSSTGSGSPRC
jgi:hypothetical protein